MLSNNVPSRAALRELLHQFPGVRLFVDDDGMFVFRSELSDTLEVWLVRNNPRVYCCVQFDPRGSLVDIVSDIAAAAQALLDYKETNAPSG